jgi:hypothetical protein
MATKKMTQAQKIRDYAAKRPNAAIKDIAHSMGLRYQAVYQVLKVKENVKTPKATPWKKAVVKHLGVTMAKDDVTKLTEEQTARLIFNNTQGRQRLEAATRLADAQHITMEEPKADNVNHPAHYKVGGIETIDFIEAKGLNYHLGNVVKYIARSDTKGNRKEDLLKARWYLNREIAKLNK